MAVNLKKKSDIAFSRVHITYIYVESLSTYFENCLFLQFVSQVSFSWQISQWLAQAVLRDKSWMETIFRIMAGRINVSICNVVIYDTLYSTKNILIWKVGQLQFVIFESLKNSLLYFNTYVRNKDMYYIVMIKTIIFESFCHLRQFKKS